MACLLRRSAAHARELLIPRRLSICEPAQRHFLFQRHLAASAATSIRCCARYYSGNMSSRYDMLNSPVNWGLIRVPEEQAFVVERFGKYSKTLHCGWKGLIPFIDRIAYVHCLSEQVIPIPSHKAITEDGVTLDINNSVVRIKIVDPYLASYGLDDPIFAVAQTTQATMSTELGKITLDRKFLWKEKLNNRTVMAINYVTTKWGIKVLNYDIGDVSLPSLIMQALEVVDIAEKLAKNSSSKGGNLAKSCTRLRYQELQRNISKYIWED